MLRGGRPVLALALTMAALIASACATPRADGFARLPEVERARVARAQQFRPGRQQERFLLRETQGQRDSFIAAMHVEERLARFPPHEREAIWAKEVVPGMTPEAVMLSFGPPERIERVEDPLHQGKPRQETWLYRGGGRQVVFVEGRVIEVVP